MVTKLLSETFIQKLKTLVFILSPEKAKEKLGIFWADNFAAYIINHMMHRQHKDKERKYFRWGKQGTFL